MNAKVFNKFMANINITGWVCCNCKYSARTAFRRIDSAIAQFAEVLAAIKAQMADMRRRQDSPRRCNRHRTLLMTISSLNQKGRPRRHLVRLTSDESAAAILKDAPKLSQYVARNVYINPDLSPDAAKLAYQARKLRRESRQQQLESRSSVRTDSPALIDAMPTNRLTMGLDTTTAVGLVSSLAAKPQEHRSSTGADSDSAAPSLPLPPLLSAMMSARHALWT